MITTIILGIFSVLFAYLSRYRQVRWGLKLSFTFIFFFLAFRYDFGNDYKVYHDYFYSIERYDQIYFLFNFDMFEPGWKLLNWFFQPFGFFAMIAVLALFNCLVYYRFIRKYVPIKYYWLAIFIYIFYPNFMLVHSSAMRQSIAIILFIISLDYLCNKNAIRYLICVGFASLFHISALILIPVYFLTLLPSKYRQVYNLLFFLFFVSIFLFGTSLSFYVKLFISKISDKYTFYQEPGVVNTGFGFFYYTLIFILVLYYEKFQIRKYALVFKVTIVSFMLMPFTLIIGMISRLGMYFMPGTIVVYPIIAINLKNLIGKVIFSTILIVCTLYQFYIFFYSDTYRDYFGTYQTIFSALQWY